MLKPHGQPFPHRLPPAVRAGDQPNLAQLTVARKLAAATLAMWKNQEVYDPKR